MSVWPPELPQIFNADDFNWEEFDGRIETEMESGETKTRMRNTSGEGRISGSMTMTISQLAIFRQFYKQKSAPFDFPNPCGEGVISVKFTQPAAKRSYRSPGRYRVSFSFKVKP